MARAFCIVGAVGCFFLVSIVSGQQADSPSPEKIAALEQQAMSGNPRAASDLGQCYAVGRGVPQDYSEAAKWFRKAAEQGLPVAQFRLAGALLHGWGVTQNTREALTWYQRAAEHGDVESAVELGQVYEDGGPMKMDKQPDGTVALGPVPQAAAIPRDFVKAAYWYRAAASRGSTLAQNHLGILYCNGQGVPQDYVKAYFWLSLGEAGGIPSSTNGVDDRDLAASHLTKQALLQAQERTRKWFEDHPAKAQ